MYRKEYAGKYVVCYGVRYGMWAMHLTALH